MKRIEKICNLLLSAIYPKKCICCSELICEEKNLCSDCETKIERNNFDEICLSCGFEKESCVCRYHIYRFNALVCVFKNDGFARKAYYAYKFNKKQHYVDFFATEICNAIKKCYADIRFDFICSVPSATRYGYDHSGYIAKKVSAALNIPYVNNILSCVKKTKKQHESTIKERLINTNGKYRYNFNINNATVLLVDDIKTTGATLDECSKELLYAGADSVYCVTALGSSTSKN